MSVPVYLYLAFLYSKTTHRVGIWTVSKDTAESRSMGHWDMKMADGQVWTSVQSHFRMPSAKGKDIGDGRT